MGSFGDELENELLDHLFGKGVYNPPTIYIALSTVDPTEDGSGMAEPSDGYARIVTAPADWTVASAGAISNANEIAFAEASGDWGTITHFALFDTITGGVFLGYGTLDTAKAVTSGDTVKFPVGDLDVDLN